MDFIIKSYDEKWDRVIASIAEWMRKKKTDKNNLGNKAGVKRETPSINALISPL